MSNVSSDFINDTNTLSTNNKRTLAKIYQKDELII